jgi:hypothetical protein
MQAKTTTNFRFWIFDFRLCKPVFSCFSPRFFVFKQLFTTGLVFLSGMLWYGGVIGYSADLNVSCREPWADMFGGTNAVFHIETTAGTAFEGRLNWSFSSMGRIISRGQTGLNLAPSQSATNRILLQVPPVKAGVVMPAKLSVSIVADDNRPVAASLEKPLWIFPDDAFDGQRANLKARHIYLFDPGQKTAQRFEQAQVPFEAVYNADTLSSVNNGLLIIGEGLDFKDYPALAPQIMQAASSGGARVLCLAPSGGNLDIPGLSQVTGPAPFTLALHRNVWMKSLDRKLDWLAWPPDGAVVISSIRLSGPTVGRGEVCAGDAGWCWLELEWDHPAGRVLMCGCSIINKWDVSPAPRFLLARLMEYLLRQDSEAQNE